MKILNPTLYPVTFHRFRTTVEETISSRATIEMETNSDEEKDYYLQIADSFGLRIVNSEEEKQEALANAEITRKIQSDENLAVISPAAFPEEPFSNVAHTPFHPEQYELTGKPTSVIETVTPLTRSERGLCGQPASRIVERGETEIMQAAVPLKLTDAQTVQVADSLPVDMHVTNTVEKSHGEAVAQGEASPTADEDVLIPVTLSDRIADPEVAGPSVFDGQDDIEIQTAAPLTDGERELNIFDVASQAEKTLNIEGKHNPAVTTETAEVLVPHQPLSNSDPDKAGPTPTEEQIKAEAGTEEKPVATISDGESSVPTPKDAKESAPKPENSAVNPVVEKATKASNKKSAK